MQGAIVMLMALSGLGCQNKIGDSGELPAAVSPIVSPAVNPAPSCHNAASLSAILRSRFPGRRDRLKPLIGTSCDQHSVALCWGMIRMSQRHAKSKRPSMGTATAIRVIVPRTSQSIAPG